MNYRHEYKFLVNSADLEIVRGRISCFLQRDVHQVAKNGYTITSLYFDSVDNRCWYENLQGCDNRRKYRIRTYGNNTQLIKLECKSKLRGLGNKIAVPLSQEECRAFMENADIPIQPEYTPEKQQMLCQMRLMGMLPKCIVQYDREAFIYPAGNVRVTFDKNIRGSRQIEAFLSGQFHTVPVLEPDVHVLEVKYDAFLPDFISEALGTDGLLQTSLSKYAQTRNILG